MARAKSRRIFSIGFCWLLPPGFLGCAAPGGMDEVTKEPQAVVVAPAASSLATPSAPPSSKPVPDGPAPSLNPPPANPPAPEPTIVQKPRPVIPTPDVTPFVKAGCVLAGSTLDCSKSASVKAFGCLGDRLQVDDSLGGLTPKAAIAECNGAVRAVVSSGSPSAPPPKGAQVPPTGIVRLGCMFPVVRRYLVSMRGKLTLVKSAAELAALFAPVESPEEALGFAVALSRAAPQYTVEIRPGWRAAPRIETSYSEPAAGGFKVHLFEYQLCGCGPHPYNAVDFLVGKDGSVSVAATQEAYADPRKDHLCID
jgi:hypothetical protein